MDALPAFNIYDIGIIALLAIGILRGLARGLSGELATLVALAVAVTAGWFLYEPVGDYFAHTFDWSDLQAHTVAAVIVILVALVLMGVLGMALKRIMSFAFRGFIERVGGMILGFARFGVIIAALIFLVYLHGRDGMKTEITEESWIGRHVTEQMTPLYDRMAEKYPELRRIAPDDYPEFENDYE